MAAEESIIDFSKICRLCLMEDSVMSSIFKEQDKHSSTVPLPLRIMSCVSVELNSVDGLPSHICTTCLCQIDGWYKFKDLCETADAVLRKCIKNEPVQVDTISQIRNKAQEIRQFFGVPNLVRIDCLDSALTELNASKKTLEIAVKNEDQIDMIPPIFSQKYVIYMSPDLYVKWLRREFKLSNRINVKRLASSQTQVKPCNSLPSYEISFDSHIENRRTERNLRQTGEIVMELGDCQVFAIGSAEGEEPGKGTETTAGDHQMVDEDDQPDIAQPLDPDQPETTSYEHEITHLEIIENVMYDFRLDEDGNLDVSSLGDIDSETELQRGVRYNCLFCSKSLRNKALYDKHVRDSHRNFLLCKVCDKQLYSLRNFLIHTRTHLGEYGFTCPVCRKRLTRASILKSHMRRHGSAGTQRCDACGKRFRGSSALKRHQRLHGGSVEFVCEICGFGTHFKANFEYHARVHANDRSYMCEVCGRRFAALASLQSHMKSHRDSVPCPHCKRTFRHVDKYRSHLARSHPNR